MPKLGTGLNLAEIELSVLSGQLQRRCLPALETSCLEMAAWKTGRHQRDASTNWQFTANDARIKPKRPYPPL